MNMMRSVLIIGGTIAVGLGLILAWALLSRPPASERGPIEYVEDPVEASTRVELDLAGIATAENFLGDRIRVISGRVTNRSDRPLRSVRLQLAFQDRDGATVHEFDGEALGSTLPPAESRSYDFRFDSLPAEWNLQLPRVRVLAVGY